MAAFIAPAMGVIASAANAVMSRKQKRSKNGKTQSSGSKQMVLYSPPANFPNKPIRRKSRAVRSKPPSSRQRSVAAPNFMGAPVNFGATVGSNTLRFNVSKPLPSAEFSPDEGIRVHGSGLLAYPLITNAAENGLFNTAYHNAFFLQPGSIDPRLSQITRCFQQYAFRGVRFRYVPSVGTTTNGSCALALVRNADLFASVALTAPTVLTNTVSTVMQFENSMMFQQGTPSEMVYRHVGVETWQCNTTSSSSDRSEVSQGFILGAYDHNETTATTLGQIWCEWIIDIYGLSAIVGSPLLSSAKDFKTPMPIEPCDVKQGDGKESLNTRVTENFIKIPAPLRRSDSTESLLTTEIRQAVKSGVSSALKPR